MREQADLENDGLPGPDLAERGWDDRWAELFDATRSAGEPGRVSERHRSRWLIRTAHGARSARIEKSAGRSLPAVGDWVGAVPGAQSTDDWLIVGVLPRRSCFSRGSALDGSEEQVLAANVDRVWIVHGLDVALNGR